MPDGLTISVTADGTISAKDVAIGGNLEDLASARGQIGDARQLADLDFNMLTVYLVFTERQVIPKMARSEYPEHQ